MSICDLWQAQGTKCKLSDEASGAVHKMQAERPLAGAGHKKCKLSDLRQAQDTKI